MHNIQFPSANESELAQDEVYFYLRSGKERERIRLHEYDRLYQTPGLYEQVVYDRLKCQSPEKVTEVLSNAVSQAEERFSELRVLDLGAGNGMMGEMMNKSGVSRLVGIDIIPEAKTATERDRPGVYDAYYVSDLTALGDDDREELEQWSFNCLTSVAALGFGDIPPHAFMQAYNLVEENGWVAFNIKETFLDHTDRTGFSKFIRELIFSDYIDLYELKRYRHRYSIEGQPLFYYALGARKNGHIPADMLDMFE